MPFGFRWNPKIGIWRLNFGKRGYNSTSTRLGPVTHNSKRGWRVNLPGGLHWYQSRRRR